MKYFRDIFKDREEVSVRYDHEDQAVWLYLNPKDRPRYSMQMLKSVLSIQKALIAYFQRSTVKHRYPIKYFIFTSQIEGIYNYGGDLVNMAQMIISKDREWLKEYAYTCIENVYLSATNLNAPVTTITLVQGDALGGGFEATLSTSVLIAEEGVKMGFPEIRFNMFPGMGAYSFLARYHGIKFAEELIGSGKIYSSEEMYEKKVVTKLAKKGEGIKAVKKFMKKQCRYNHGMHALQKVQQIYKPLSYSEMIDITDLWVETALNISDSDIKMMYKLVGAQNGKNINLNKIRTYQDRRISNDKVIFPIIDSEGNKIYSNRRKNIDRRKSA